MATLLIILAGLLVTNFLLLKFSIQSTDTNKKKTRSKSIGSTKSNAKIDKETEIQKAA